MDRLTGFLAWLLILGSLVFLAAIEVKAAQHVVIGDSMVSNVAPDGDFHTRWPEMALSDHGGVINRGWGGTQIDTWVDWCTPGSPTFNCWWTADLEPHQTVWIELGTNDILIGLEPVESMIADWNILIDIVLDTGVRDIRVIHGPHIWRPNSIAYNTLINDLALAQQDMCAERLYVVCATTMQLVMPEHTYDNIHWNQSGHDIMAARVAAVVPEPSTYVLLASGLAGLAVLGRRSKA